MVEYNYGQIGQTIKEVEHMNKVKAVELLHELFVYRVKGTADVPGLQSKYKFPNGFGASLIYTPVSYDLELAVLDFRDDPDGTITYDTPIANDVLGYLSWAKAVEYLIQIKDLKGETNE